MTNNLVNKMPFYIHLLEIILFFKLYSLRRVSMISLVYSKSSYSSASPGTLIQTFPFCTLRITAEQVKVQHSWSLMRSHIFGVMPCVCIASFHDVGSANTCKKYSIRLSQDMPMSTEWCRKKYVPIKARSKSLQCRQRAAFFQVKTQLNDRSTSHLLVRT